MLVATLATACEGTVDPATRTGTSEPGQADGLLLSDGGAPMADELCDGFDNNGDGQVDEGCLCTPGEVAPCYPGPKVATTGHCKMGSMTCFGSAEFGGWGSCSGAVTAMPEVCGDGIDQDCDGSDLPCAPQCGDGSCNAEETCMNCPQDCGACAPYCGDGKCNGNEACTTCPKDCGTCPTSCESFTFAVSSRPVDIVWIVDQSGSMSSEIAMVKQNMNNFAAYINGTKIDYHVIVLARRGSSNKYDICIPQPLAGPNCSDGPRFRQVNQAVYSTDSLTKVKSHIGAIEGFMRPHSLRVFVEVSDDNSSLPASSFQSWLKARDKAYNDFIFHSIVGLSSGGCVAREGTVYKQLSTWTKGLMSHICNANWSNLFNTLGQKVSDIAKTQYKLAHQPVVKSITVQINGVAKQMGSDWIYDVQNQQLVLVGPLPGAGAKIKVCYQHKP